ncbi:peptidoglycan-associated lipoprotein Pal [bacterium]
MFFRISKPIIILVLISFSLFNAGCSKKYLIDEEQADSITSQLQTDMYSASLVPEPNIRDKEFEKQDALKAVYFDYDKAILTQEARRQLEKNALWLKNYDKYHVLIEGHSDERGTIEYNLALGQNRASIVRSYLVFLGVNAGRIGTISYGEEKPAVLGSSDDIWSKNRRAEVLFFK